MKKLYGSLSNRFEENKMYCDEIKVGTGVTNYFYSDSQAYEVTQVINQGHVFIRRMTAKRNDGGGMSDCQSYDYISNPADKEIELVLRNGVWMSVREYSKPERFESVNDEIIYFIEMCNLTPKERERVEAGKTVKKYRKFGNISFGVMQEYFDYSF